MCANDVLPSYSLLQRQRNGYDGVGTLQQMNRLGSPPVSVSLCRRRASECNLLKDTTIDSEPAYSF